eukprot:scaffold194123_cov36-Prasinocladus_malaysianus.AAC.1
MDLLMRLRVVTHVETNGKLSGCTIAMEPTYNHPSLQAGRQSIFGLLRLARALPCMWLVVVASEPGQHGEGPPGGPRRQGLFAAAQRGGAGAQLLPGDIRGGPGVRQCHPQPAGARLCWGLWRPLRSQCVSITMHVKYNQRKSQTRYYVSGAMYMKIRQLF